MTDKKVGKKVGRDWNAVDAHFRRGSPMKHKATARGGVTFSSKDLEDQGREELIDDEPQDEKDEEEK